MAVAGVPDGELERLAAEAASLHTLLDQVPTAIVVAEATRGQVVVFNEAAERILGHPIIPTSDVHDYARYGAEHPDGRRFSAEEHPLARALGGEIVAHELVLYRRGDGVVVELSVNAAAVRDGVGRVVAAVTSFVDVSEQRRRQAHAEARLERLVEERTAELLARTAELDRVNAELVALSERLEETVRTRTAELEASRAALAHQARHDPLTGLPNRVLLEERLEAAVAAARRHARVMALLFVDLDGFKGVNDAFGHEAGDDVLRQAAARLGGGLRRGDTIARLGGDEFVVVVGDLARPEDAEEVAASLLASLSEPFAVGRVPVALNASIGVSVYPVDATDATTLHRHADAAMYAAKAAGKGRIATFAGSAGEAAG